MLLIEYTPQEKGLGDAQASRIGEWCKFLLENFPSIKSIRLSNILAIDSIRAAIKSGKISNKDVAFVFNGIVFSCDKNGRFVTVPEGYDDYYMKILEELL